MEYFILGIIILGFYLLFIRGYFWKLIIFFFGWIGLYTFLSTRYDAGDSTFMNILGHDISWAVFIPTVIVILAMATTKVEV